MTTATMAKAKDTTPGSMLFGIYGTNVDHITYIHQAEKQVGIWQKGLKNTQRNC